MWIAYVDILCGYLMWIAYVDILCGYLMWISYVDMSCGYIMWIAYADILCGYLMWISQSIKYKNSLTTLVIGCHNCKNRIGRSLNPQPFPFQSEIIYCNINKPPYHKKFILCGYLMWICHVDISCGYLCG